MTDLSNDELDKVVAWLKTDKEDEPDLATMERLSEQLRFRRRHPARRVLGWAIAASVILVAGSLVLNRAAFHSEPRVALDPAGHQAIPVAMRAAPSYHKAVADLENILREGRGHLDAKTQKALESSIALIDLAIRQSESALAADTSNEFVVKHLDELRQTKLAALRDAAGVVRAKM